MGTSGTHFSSLEVFAIVLGLAVGGQALGFFLGWLRHGLPHPWTYYQNAQGFLYRSDGASCQAWFGGWFESVLRLDDVQAFRRISRLRAAVGVLWLRFGYWRLLRDTGASK